MPSRHCYDDQRRDRSVRLRRPSRALHAQAEGRLSATAWLSPLCDRGRGHSFRHRRFSSHAHTRRLDADRRGAIRSRLYPTPLRQQRLSPAAPFIGRTKFVTLKVWAAAIPITFCQQEISLPNPGIGNALGFLFILLCTLVVICLLISHHPPLVRFEATRVSVLARCPRSASNWVRRSGTG